MIDQCISRISILHQSKTHKLQDIWKIMCEAVRQEKGTARNKFLHETIDTYFQQQEEGNSAKETTNTIVVAAQEAFIRSDIKVFLQSNLERISSARQVARICHGIGSPAFPNYEWDKNHCWGRYKNIDFDVLLQIIQEELVHAKS